MDHKYNYLNKNFIKLTLYKYKLNLKPSKSKNFQKKKKFFFLKNLISHPKYFQNLKKFKISFFKISS